MYNKHTKTFPLQPQTDTIATHPQPKKKEKEKMSAHKMPLPLSLMSPPPHQNPFWGGGARGRPGHAIIPLM